MILSYELRDDHTTVHEVEVPSFSEACRITAGMSGMIVWAYLEDAEGEQIADTWELL